MHDPTQEINSMLRKFYLEKYEDIFYVIVFGFSGTIHLSQLYRWITKNQYQVVRVFPKIVADWERIGLVKRNYIGSNVILYLRWPVYSYFGLTYYKPASSLKILRNSLIMEKFLTEDQYYLLPPAALRNRLSKTNIIGFLPSGESHLRIINNYKKALAPYHWNTIGLDSEAQIMQNHIDLSPSKNHFAKSEKSIRKADHEENLYSLGYKGVYLTGAKLQANEDGTIIFTVCADIFNVTDMNAAKLAKLIMSTYSTLGNILYDSDSKHKSKIIITVYSHQQMDKDLIEKVFQRLKSTKEFCYYTDEMLSTQVRFSFFNTAKRLFAGIESNRIV